MPVKTRDRPEVRGDQDGHDDVRHLPVWDRADVRAVRLEGFMYMRGFLDLDGHQWSFIHMDTSAIPEQ
jgi:hypothetical protein